MYVLLYYLVCKTYKLALDLLCHYGRHYKYVDYLTVMTKTPIQGGNVYTTVYLQ